MRQKINENPVLQIAIFGALAIAIGFFVLHPLGGGGESEAEGAPAPTEEVAVAPEEAAATGSTAEAGAGVADLEPTAATTSVELPQSAKLPHAVSAAYHDGETIVLLIYRKGGIDDKLTREAAAVAEGMSGVAFFETEIDHIARYSEITGPIGVQQVPALIVVRPKKLNNGGPAEALLNYGFQTGEDVRQAIVDSRYKGPELTYAPK